MDDDLEGRRLPHQQESIMSKPIHDGLLYHKSTTREMMLQNYLETHGTNEDESDYDSSNRSNRSFVSEKEIKMVDASTEILEAYRMLKNEDDNTYPSMLSMEESSMQHYPNDAICTRKGFHFTDDFKCVGREPGIRSTCQNYRLECKVTGKIFTCQTVPLDDSNRKQQLRPAQTAENKCKLMRQLDHYALPRLVQVNESDNRMYLITACSRLATDSNN